MANSESPKETAGGTVHRVVRLLGVLASSGGSVGVSDISQALGLPVSTVHRLLNLLRAEGIVEFQPASRKYGIGTELFRISAQVAEIMPLSGLARPILDRLAAEYDETIILGLYLPGHLAMTFAACAEGSHALQYRIDLHELMPLGWGASGKSILAYLDESTIATVLDQMQPSPASSQAAPDREILLSQLADVRRKGYAISNGEKLAGAQGIAAPFTGSGDLRGCICLTAPATRMAGHDLDQIGLRLIAAARELSYALGASR